MFITKENSTMKRSFITALLAVAALLLTISPAFAEEEPVRMPVVKNKPAKTSAKKYRKAVAVKPVDINSAGKEALKKLPGITDAYADKIIAGRPYPSKARLVTDKILPDGIYSSISGSIVAKQPYADGAKNAAVYSKKK